MIEKLFRKFSHKKDLNKNCEQGQLWMKVFFRVSCGPQRKLWEKELLRENKVSNWLSKETISVGKQYSFSFLNGIICCSSSGPSDFKISHKLFRCWHANQHYAYSGCICISVVNGWKVIADKNGLLAHSQTKGHCLRFKNRKYFERRKILVWFSLKQSRKRKSDCRQKQSRKRKDVFSAVDTQDSLQVGSTFTKGIPYS